ncbi:MAG: hypothetical protein KGY80_06170 [Candidatus Thorarchaeota archaeon]|nr:hypothetical protein [Candidatus Thorarchaeota archaeon]
MNHLDKYEKFSKYREECEKDGIVDLSSEHFFFPTTLLPLFDLIRKEKPKIIFPEDEDVANYFRTITDGSRFKHAARQRKSYLPIVELPKQEEETDRILRRLYEINEEGEEFGGESAFKYLVGEIVDNIYQHSEFSNALVMAQKYESQAFTESCFFDDGLTINGCFRKHGMGRAEDVDAIWDAINGTSTKSKERGFGLNSVISIFTDGIEGEVFIVSGRGAISLTRNDHIRYSLNNAYELSGTLVTVRTPCPAPVVDIYDYVE